MMEIILKEDVEKVGKAGEKARVAAGYARNYLIPQGLAIKATERALKDIEEHMKRRAKRLAEEKADAEKMAEALSQLKLEFTRKAGEEGKLFGSVTASEIGKEVVAKGFNIDKRKVLLDVPLKQLGEHKVPIKLHPEVTAEITVEVKPEGGETIVAPVGEEPAEKAPSETPEETAASETAGESEEK
jgi:large subunit ribosomal protein L9